MLPEHTQLFENYCFICQDSSCEEGGVNLENLGLTISKDNATAKRCQRVLDVLNSGEMPPKEMEQSPDDIKPDFLEQLANRMVVPRGILKDAGGKITMRRLNRLEY